VIKIFLSYAREDYAQAEKLYDSLNSIPSIDVWLDRKSLLPGQNWKEGISDAIRDCNLFLVLISTKSNDKVGHYQKEIKEALEILDNYPNNKVFVVPVRLDDCTPHNKRLADLQRVDIFPESEWYIGITQLMRLFQFHRQPESGINNPTTVRFRTHQAVFSQSPVTFYFLTITNLQNQPIELTHIWYEDANHHIAIQYQSRPLPKRLGVNEGWETWLSTNHIPDEYRDNAYDLFRIRLSTGEVFASSKDDTTPPIGTIPGGGISPSDIDGFLIS
jgi:hypothetical protein